MGSAGEQHGALLTIILLRTVEEWILQLGRDVCDNRAAIYLSPMCAPAAFLCGTLCGMHSILLRLV